MKREYTFPTMKIEILEKADVILALSGPSSDEQQGSSQALKMEIDNRYMDISSFLTRIL